MDPSQRRWLFGTVYLAGVLLIWTIAQSASVVAQSRAAPPLPDVTAWVDSTQGTLGEPIALTIRLHHQHHQQPVLSELQPVGSGGELSISLKTPPVSSRVQELTETILEYEVRPYSIGVHEIPPITVAFVNADGDTIRRSTHSIEIEAISVLREGEDRVRDIAPPVEIPGGIPIWLVALAVSALLILVVVATLWFFDRRKRPDQVVEDVPPLDYVQEFQRIAGMDLLERGDFKAFYTLLSELLRRFLEEFFSIDALEQTTTEISIALRSAEVEKETIREVVGFLGVADLVKFARFLPDLDNARRAPESAIAIVRSVEDRRNQATSGEGNPVADREAFDAANMSGRAT